MVYYVWPIKHAPGRHNQSLDIRTVVCGVLSDTASLYTFTQNGQMAKMSKDFEPVLKQILTVESYLLGLDTSNRERVYYHIYINDEERKYYHHTIYPYTIPRIQTAEEINESEIPQILYENKKRDEEKQDKKIFSDVGTQNDTFLVNPIEKFYYKEFTKKPEICVPTSLEKNIRSIILMSR